MSVVNLLIAVFLFGLLLFRFSLDAEGRGRTRLLTAALLTGVISFSLTAYLLLASAPPWAAALRLTGDALYVLFFLLLAVHYTSRSLPLVGYWVPQIVLLLTILLTGYLDSSSVEFGSPGYSELSRTLLFLSATLAFVTICRSREMLDNHPVFWIPTLIVSTAFGVATMAKLLSTLVQFSGGGPTVLVATVSTSLGIVATVLLLIFLTANISWFRKTK